MLLIAGLLIQLLGYQQNPYCKIYGSFFEVDYAHQADYIIYEEESEGSADVIVYEQLNRLYADRPGMWFFTDKKDFAQYKIYFSKKRQDAHFSVYFTTFESFAGCNQ